LRGMENISPRDANKTISTFAEATRANLNDPLRKGNVIYLPAEGDVLISADLHGNVENFKKIVKKAALVGNPSRQLIVQELIHGSKSSVENGDYSFILLEWAAALKVKFPGQVHILLGNHDQAELANIRIVKYGKVVGPAMHRGLRETYGENHRRVWQAYLSFMRSLPLASRTSFGTFISNSTPEKSTLDFFDMSIFERELEDADYEKGNSVFHLVWGRDHSEAAASTFAAFVEASVLIIGHNPCEEGYDVPNRYHIVIDCKDEKGCFILMPLDRALSQKEVVEHIIPINYLPGDTGGL